MKRRTDSVLHITPADYREFAEITKASGMVLRLFEQPAQIIGLRSGIDASVIDATSDAEVGSLVEPPSLLLCSSIDAAHVRRFGPTRYECDVSQLTDAEMYRFWLHHEIGHRADNYCALSFQLSPAADDPDFRRDTLDRIDQANEILADRWAWAQVCDRPMPLTACGKRDQDAIATELEFLDQVTGGRKNYAKRPFPHVKPGQYHAVPLRMLAREDTHAWIGPDISPSVIERARAYEVRAMQSPQHQLPERLIGRIRERPQFRAGHIAPSERKAA